MNKKQREAKRKNAQQHQKKMQALNKEREAIMTIRKEVPHQVFRATQVFTQAEPPPLFEELVFPDPKELYSALSSDPDLVSSIAKAMDARVRHDDVLEGEFHVVEGPVKQLP